MRIHLLRAAVIPLAALICVPAFCQCKPSVDKTYWGGNTNVVFHKSQAQTDLHGLVTDELQKPLKGVLVEVYDHPEIMLQNPSRNRTGQVRLAACVTDGTGNFMLDVPPGHYELRLSKSMDWNVTSVDVTVKKSAVRSKKG